MRTSGKPCVVRKLLSFVSPICLGLAAIYAVLAGLPRTATAAGAIVTDQGPLKGFSVPGENVYVGIPYAAPPVGNLRWRPPQPPARFKGLFQATQFGNPCVQSDGIGGTFGSEDCLSLNVYVPTAMQPAHGFPVMVYIHGGGLVSGTGFFQDPTPLVEQGGVIAVTINYRLGYLGFFAHPALDSEGHLAGNYGLMDQQFALKWVRRNIGAFGGDRNRVTIFGESAGGLSVYSNLASPTAAGLFQRAISESGAYVSFAGHFPFADYLVGIVPLAVAESFGSLGFGFVPPGIATANGLGCTNLTSADCLRALPASTLVEAEPAGVFPFVDGTLLTQAPGAAINSGNFNRVPVISGSNHDEYRLFVAASYDYLGNPLLDAEYQTAVTAFIFPPNPSLVTFLVNVAYPLSNYTPQPPGLQSAPLALGALGSDIIFACPARNAALSLSQYVPTYAYEFNDENAPLDFYTLGPASFPLGAYHTSELQYLFNLIGPLPTFTPDQQTLSEAMIGYWTQFAKTGNPNSEGAPAWSQYSTGGSLESLAPPTAAAESDSSFDGNHQCSGFWNTF